MMGKSSKALRREVEQYEAEMDAKLRNLTKAELKEWCKKQFDFYDEFQSSITKIIDPNRIINMNGFDNHAAATIALAQQDGVWFDALKAALEARRSTDGQIPAAYRSYYRKVVFGINKRTSATGKASEVVRNYIICLCIQKIVKHTAYKATRNEVSFDTECASSILSELFDGELNPASVQKIWINRSSEFGANRYGLR